jgi:dTDP-4-dehydrorhamnose reductase
MAPLALVTGAAGLIGHYLVKTASQWAPQWDVRGLTRFDLDLTDEAGVRQLWGALRPQLVFHCAAMSRTGACEQDPALAKRINVDTTALLADLAADVPFVFLSSDQVFDGRKGWYVETDGINPVNVYGQTKVAAEQIVLKNPQHTVVRLALTAGISPTGDRSFVEDMCRAVERERRLTLFTDEFRNPLPAGVVARALWELIDHERPGLYHLGGADRLSRLEIGELLAVWHPELAICMQAGSVANYQGPTRPPDLSMCCDKIQNLLSFQVPGLRSWLTARTRRGNDLWDYVIPDPKRGHNP